MTNDNKVTYTPQAYSQGSLNVDLFGPHQSFYQSRDQPRYHYRVQASGERGKYKGELILYDFRGGTGLTYGDFNRDFDRSRFDIENSQADARFSRFLTLPTKTTTKTYPDYSGTSTGMSHERIAMPQALAGGLVAYYDFEDAAGDLLDNVGSNDLTETDGTIASTTGIVGNARDFERGDTEYFSAADAAWNSITGDMTITAWINPETATGIFQGIVSKLTVAGDQVSYLLGINDLGQVTFECSSDGTRTGSSVWNQVQSTTILSTSTWYFCVGRHRNGNNVEIMINAVSEETATHTAGIYNGTAAFEIGAYNVNSSNFDGIIDEVGVWNRVLTDDEVTYLYNAGAGRTYAAITGLTATAQQYTIIGVGSGANASLFFEEATGGATDPVTIGTVPYSPGSM